MDQSDRDELLTRIDQKMTNVEAVLFDKPKYSSIKEKVLLHDKVLWVVVTASLVVLVKSLCGV